MSTLSNSQPLLPAFLEQWFLWYGGGAWNRGCLVKTTVPVYHLRRSSSMSTLSNSQPLLPAFLEQWFLWYGGGAWDRGCLLSGCTHQVRRAYFTT